MIFLLLISLTNLQACVTFVINRNNSLVFGWNYEFDCGSGFLIVHKRGLHKYSFVLPKENPIEWISKYGSLTFNQWGKEFPSGGINEKGLVVVQAIFLKTRYPNPDSRPNIVELQWIQYQLDNFSTTQEVIESDKVLRISNNSIPLHYMICDKSGNVAIIEFIDGIMTCHKDIGLPYPVLANDSYETSLLELQKYQGFGGAQTIPTNSTGPKSGNFIIAADFVTKYNSENIIDYSFKTLSRSSEPKRTQWSVVFDIIKNEIHFKSLLNGKVKKVTIGEFDYTCNSTIKLLDISANNNNDFMIYSHIINADYVNKAYNDPSIPWIKEAVPEDINKNKIKYIETVKCK